MEYEVSNVGATHQQAEVTFLENFVHCREDVSVQALTKPHHVGSQQTTTLLASIPVCMYVHVCAYVVYVCVHVCVVVHRVCVCVCACVNMQECYEFLGYHS